MIGNKELGIPAHPGFTGYVGATWKPGARLVEGSDEASYQALENQAKGGAFLEAYKTLKGGGQITEVEGKKATEAITRMNKAQNEDEYIKAALEYRSIIKKGIDRGKKGQSPSGMAIPEGAKSMLKNNPALREAFDAKYGVGASMNVLGK